MTFETLRIDKAPGGVAHLILARADKHNALSAKMITELTDAALRLAQDASVRIVVLSAEGASFCAGGDLNWMKDQFAATRAERMAEARRLAMMLRALNELPKPLIGRVHGPAYGGGVGLLAVCDVAIAADDAMFGLTETRLGLIPATISPYVLARMGEGNARKVFMSARLFSADEAVTLGLIARAVAPEALDAAIDAEIKPYLSASPDAVARAKRLARNLGLVIDDAVIDATIEQLADAWESPDAQEGIAAFFEKRKPSWIPR